MSQRPPPSFHFYPAQSLKGFNGRDWPSWALSASQLLPRLQPLAGLASAKGPGEGAAPVNPSDPEGLPLVPLTRRSHVELWEGFRAQERLSKLPDSPTEALQELAGTEKERGGGRPGCWHHLPPLPGHGAS